MEEIEEGDKVTAVNCLLEEGVRSKKNCCRMLWFADNLGVLAGESARLQSLLDSQKSMIKKLGIGDDTGKMQVIRILRKEREVINSVIDGRGAEQINKFRYFRKS